MKLAFILIFSIGFAYSNTEEFLPNKFSVEIEQVYKRFGKGKEVRVPFVLEYSYPGQMKYLNQKNKSLFMCNKESSWYYVPSFLKSRPGTVKINSGESVRLVSLFDSLRAGLVSNETYQVEKESESKYLLKFSPKAQKEFNVLTAELVVSTRALIDRTNSRAQKMGNRKRTPKAFTLKDLDQILIEYRDKKKLTLEFKSFEKDVAFNSKHFIFSIPENTKIIK